MSATEHKAHYVGLDGLRGVAAFAVVIFHCRGWVPTFPLADHAYLAVDFFFILSGLVVDHAYRKRLQGSMTLGDFALARIIRLYPMLTVGTLLGFPVALVTYGNRMLLALPVALLGLPIPAAWATTPFTINVPAWSLFFELVANLLYAIIGFKLRWPGVTVVVVVSGAMLMRGAHAFHTFDMGAFYKTFGYGFPRVIFSFAIGMLLSALVRRIRLPRVPFWVLAVMLVATLIIPALRWGEVPYALFNVIAIYPAILALGCFCDVGRAVSRIVVWLGAISYPIYVVHMPVRNFVEYAIPQHLGLGAICVVVVTSASFAHILLHSFDAPIRDRLRNRLKRRMRLQSYHTDTP